MSERFLINNKKKQIIFQIKKLITTAISFLLITYLQVFKITVGQILFDMENNYDCIFWKPVFYQFRYFHRSLERFISSFSKSVRPFPLETVSEPLRAFLGHLYTSFCLLGVTCVALAIDMANREPCSSLMLHDKESRFKNCEACWNDFFVVL